MAKGKEMTRCAPFVFLCFYALPVFAQSSNSCSEDWDIAEALIVATIPVKSDQRPILSNDWCQINDVRWTQGAVVFEVEHIAWRGDTFDELRSGQSPVSLSAHIEGLRIFAAPDDPVFSYLLRLQQSRNAINLKLDVSWDPHAGEVTVAKFFVDFPGENSLGLKANMTGMTQDQLFRRNMSKSQVGLTELEIEIQSNGLVETYGMTIWQRLLDGSSDPEADVENMKAAAVLVVDDAPDKVLDRQSRAALVMAIEDLPAPSGTLTLRGKSAKPFGPQQTPRIVEDPLFLSDGGSTFWAILDGVEISAAYIPTHLD